MGLSLNPLKKIWDQVNPLDNGRTYQNSQGNGQQQSVLHQLTHNGATNVVGDVAKPVVHFVTPAAQMGKGLYQGVEHIATSPIEWARAGVAAVTNNQSAHDAAFKRAMAGPLFAKSVAQGIPRAAYQLGESMNPFGGDVYDRSHTFGGPERFLFGTDPLPSMQKTYKETKDKYGTARAQGEAWTTAITDVLGGKAIASKTLATARGLKGAVPAAAEDAAATAARSGETVKIPVKSKGTTETIPVKNLDGRLGEIRQQLKAMPSPNDVTVSKFNAKTSLAEAIKKVNNSSYEAAKKQSIIKQLNEYYKQKTANIDAAVKSRTALDEEASAIKTHPAYQAAHPIEGPIVDNVARDPMTVSQAQMADSVVKIKGVRGDDELPYGGAKPKVTVKSATPDTLDMLRIKLSRVKDPVRKAELQAEMDQRFPTRATVNTKPLPVVEAQGGPNALLRTFTSARDVIAQHGEGGAEIARRLQLQRDASEIGQEGFVEKIPSVLKLKKKDFSTFVDALDHISNGRSIRVPDHIGEAILEWQKAIPEIRDRAVATGIDVGDLGPNYFPRFYKNLESLRGRKQIAAEMVRKGEATDVGDAMGKIRLMQRDYTRTFGNLEKNRVGNIGGYEKTHEALLAYISRSMDRITKAEQFGGKNEALNQLIGAAEQEGFDVRPGGTFDRTLKTAIGDTDYSTAGHKASRVVRNVNAVRSLSTSSITNATQTVNTGVIAGVGRTIVGVAKALVSKDERLGARQAGVLLDHTINDLAKQGLGTSSQITGSIASPFFRTVEKFNRTVSAVVGKDWGNSLAKKAFNGSGRAEAVLREKLRVTGDIGEKLTREQEIQASRALTELSQFKVDPQDLPAWVDTPTGKIIAQFRTFGYKQTGFVFNQVLREATKGNFLPLTRYVLTGTPAAVVSGTAKALIKGQKLPYSQDDFSDPKKAAKATVRAMSSVGAGGLPGQEAQNLKTSSDYGNTLQGVAGTVFGPTGSGVAETAVNIDKARAGNSQPLKKEGIRNIPGVGSILSNRIYPSKVTDATTRYFTALDNAAKTFKGDKKGAAEFSDYVAHSKDPSNGKTIQSSPAESLNNSRMLFANDKVRQAVVKFEKDGGKHAPSWDLPDDKLKAYMQYKSQYTGDAAKTVLHDQFEHKYGDGSIKAIQDADSKFYSSLPKSKYGSEPSKQTPKYPSFDDATKTVMATYNAAPTEDKGKLMDQYGDIITGYFNKTAQWTNAMRRAEGAPEKNDYPVASPEVSKIMESYYALPTHDGKKGGNASRYAWIQAHPAEYKQMQDYLSQSSLFSLIGEASKAQFKGTAPSQKLLKDIKNIGTYDIATYTDKNGDTVYGLNPADAYLQSKGGSGSGSGYYPYSSGSNQSYKMTKYFGDTSAYRVAKPRTAFRTTKFNIKNGVKPSVKAKTASKSTGSKKVSLKKSLV